MLHLFNGLALHTGFMLVLALILVLVYEAINGFHDTANAVATVIYTRALRSQLAIAMSGLFNFIGVLMGGLSVAYTIVHLLPTDILLNVSSAHSLAMIFAMLVTAIFWNLGTWYFCLPASSSHTLIGAIIGISLTNALLSDQSVMQALNIPQLIEILLSLMISPLVGFILAGSIIFTLRRYFSNKKHRIHLTPVELEQKDGKHKPPFLIRIALIISSVGISVSHGANDGQKGIGLIMLMLIGIAPAGFVVNMNASSDDISHTSDAINNVKQYYIQHSTTLLNVVSHNDTPLGTKTTVTSNRNSSLPISLPSAFSGLKLVHAPAAPAAGCELSHALITLNRASLLLSNINSYEQLNPEERSHVRYLLMCIADTADKLAKLPETSTVDKRFLSKLRQDLLYMVEYAPMWIIITVALALSLGTMMGWRRITTTIGEKIGKKEMTYAQGISAQITAALSIGIASYTGLPVSTTHVLSSAVTGTMLVDGGGVQVNTVKNIFLAWILTLPVAIIIASSLYWLTSKLI